MPLRTVRCRPRRMPVGRVRQNPVVRGRIGMVLRVPVVPLVILAQVFRMYRRVICMTDMGAMNAMRVHIPRVVHRRVQHCRRGIGIRDVVPIIPAVCVIPSISVVEHVKMGITVQRDRPVRSKRNVQQLQDHRIQNQTMGEIQLMIVIKHAPKRVHGRLVRQMRHVRMEQHQHREKNTMAVRVMPRLRHVLCHLRVTLGIIYRMANAWRVVEAVIIAPVIIADIRFRRGIIQRVVVVPRHVRVKPSVRPETIARVV